VCIGVTLDTVWNVFKTTSPRPISKVIKYYSFVIFISFCVESSFKIQWCQYSDFVYFFDHNVEMRMKKTLFIPDLLLLKLRVAFSSANV